MLVKSFIEMYWKMEFQINGSLLLDGSVIGVRFAYAFISDLRAVLHKNVIYLFKQRENRSKERIIQAKNEYRPAPPLRFDLVAGRAKAIELLGSLICDARVISIFPFMN